MSVVDDARVRWQTAESEAQAAFRAALGNPDPEASRRSNALRKVADDLKARFDIAAAASEEARLVPIRSIDVERMREKRTETDGASLVTTLLVVAAPLGIAAIAIRLRR